MAFTKRFNQKYKQNPQMFGDTPMPVLVEALKHVHRGDALDLGVGNGRNTIYLVKNSFSVTGVDISKEGINLVKKKLPDSSNVDLHVGDVMSYETEKRFDLVCAIGLLHFLDKNQVGELISKMKMYTKIGGVNVIAARMTQNIRNDLPHIFSKNELKIPYKNKYWEILFYNEKDMSRAKIASIIARKVL